jgi:hypothetical protein
MNIQGVLSTALTFLKDVTISNFGRTPCIAWLQPAAPGCFDCVVAWAPTSLNMTAEMLQTRARGFLNLAGQVGVDHRENAGREKCIFREFSQPL